MPRIVFDGFRPALVSVLLLGLSVILGPSPSQAQPSPPRNSAIPESLGPWIPWVLAASENELCAELQGTRRCAWPGSLRVDAEASGGRFELITEIDAPAPQILPGGEGLWPTEVSLDGAPAVVLKSGGAPVVELEPGRHLIRGTFAWTIVPDTLPIGSDTAFVRVFLSGKELPLVKRDEGKIWLQGTGSGSTASSERDSVTLTVSRRIQDGELVTVETRLVFEVSGHARELALKNPFLPGSLPLRVSGDLAVRLEPSGDLRVQLVPGRHQLVLSARPSSVDGPFLSPARQAPWPSEEIWTFAPEPKIRSVELSGLAGIDASRTDLPSEWRSLGAYVARSGDELKVVTTRRGQEQVPENQLRLDRTLWLDEAGDTYTVLDQLSGEMRRGWRLDLSSGELGSVRSGSEKQVVTLGENAERGVEVRESKVDVTAVSRLPRTSSLRAVGWSEDVRALSAHVILPPGWNIIAAFGVDRPTGTWIDRWDLFDLFYVLIVSLALYRLLGKVAGVVSLCALVLLRGETDAPEYYWLPLVALGALSSFLPAGFWQRLTRALFFLLAALLTIALLTFTVGQVRGAIYPHLREPGAFDATSFRAPTIGASPAPMELQDQDEAKEGGMGAPEAPASASALEESYARKVKRSIRQEPAGAPVEQLKYKPDAITQSGPGVPESTNNVWHLEWTGPVVKEHEMRLLLLSPNAHRCITVLRIISLLALTFLVLRHFWPASMARRGLWKSAPVAVALFFATSLSLGVSTAAAEEPSDARLAELKSRLLTPPPCSPDCVSVSALRLELGREFQLEAEVHAGTRLAYRLPGPLASFSGVRVFLDDRSEVPSLRGPDGHLYVRLQPGVHKVRLLARIESERITLDLGTSPERVTVQAAGWLVSGLNDLGQAPSGALTLQREIRSSAAGAEAQNAIDNIPPYFLVHRTLDLAVTPSVSTQALRVSDPGAPEQLQLALINGEHVITPGLEADKNRVILGFSAQVSERSFQSRLSLPESQGSSMTLTLSAPQDQPYVEVWTIRCGVIYHCETEGVVPSSYLEGGRSVLTFHPRPGERLAVKIRAPEPAKGEYLTVQSAHMTTSPGVRSSDTTLSIAFEVSRSMVHTIRIPEHSRAPRVLVNGAAEAVKFDHGALQIPLHPGSSNIEIAWQSPIGIATIFRAPQVELGAPGVNLRTSIDVPHDRWLLWVGGPSRGPALLYWGYLLLIVLAAGLLSRLPYAPLGFGKWLLLGLGLTQVSSEVAVLTAGWFFVIGSRRAWPEMPRWLHNLVHVGVVLYSLSFLSGLISIVYAGLVGSPDMEVTGAGSHAGQLTWYVDRSSGTFGNAFMLSVSLWIWRGVMLAWSFWLATSLLGWLKWAFAELKEGEFWRPRPQPAKAPVVSSEDGPDGPDDGLDPAVREPGSEG